MLFRSNITSIAKIWRSYQIFAIDVMFAGLLVTAVLGWLATITLDWLERRAMPWRTEHK